MAKKTKRTNSGKKAGIAVRTEKTSAIKATSTIKTAKAITTNAAKPKAPTAKKPVKTVKSALQVVDNPYQPQAFTIIDYRRTR